MERMADSVRHGNRKDVRNQYELIPCGLDKPFHGYTNVRLIYCPQILARKLDLKQAYPYRRIFDMRVRDSSQFLEYAIGIAQVSPLRAQDITLGYTLSKERWFLKVPQEGRRVMYISSPSVQGLYYRLFYDYIIDNIQDQDFREETIRQVEQTSLHFV